ncbi:MAG: DNA-directed RNA polymerase subunit omega [Halanaerobiaceae bacterium]
MITEPSAEQLNEKVDSLYSLIIMASRRARQLNAGAERRLEKYRVQKPVSMSLEEIEKGKVTYNKK